MSSQTTTRTRYIDQIARITDARGRAWVLEIKTEPMSSWGTRQHWGPYHTAAAAIAGLRQADALFMSARLIETTQPAPRRDLAYERSQYDI